MNNTLRRTHTSLCVSLSVYLKDNNIVASYIAFILYSSLSDAHSASTFSILLQGMWDYVELWWDLGSIHKELGIFLNPRIAPKFWRVLWNWGKTPSLLHCFFLRALHNTRWHLFLFNLVRPKNYWINWNKNVRNIPPP